MIRTDGRTIWACRAHSDAEAARAEVLPPGGPFGLIRDPELWVTAVGPNEHLVFGVLREVAGLSPAEAKAVVRSGAFKVCNGWPMHLEPWRARLEAAGAATELRYP